MSSQHAKQILQTSSHRNDAKPVGGFETLLDLASHQIYIFLVGLHVRL
jgi:hypothetical protein